MTSTTASHTRIPAGIPAGIAAGIPATCPDVTSTNAESSDDPAGIGVAVVVAAFERPVELQILVDSLAAQTRRPDEVIVVDDGSATPLAPRFPTDDETEWTLLRQPNGGPGAARDHGIRAAHSEIIVILDDDMVADAELVAAHVAAHLDGAEVVQGRFHNADPASRPLFDRFIDDNLQRYFDDCADDPTAVDPARLATGNMSMRRAAYLAVDGFATDLDRREDADLGLRLASIGARFGFADRAVSIHDEPAEPLGRWLTVARQYGEAETELAERHASHSIDRVRDDMPGPIRAALTLGRRTPKLLAVSGRLAASAAVLAERTGLRSVALRGYGGAYALSWFAGVYTPTPPSASDRVHPPVSDQGHHRVHIGHAGIDAIGFDAAIDRIIEAADGDATFSVVTPNVDHLVLLERDEEFRAAYRCAGLVLADGQPIVLASRLLGLPLTTKVSGSDLFVPLLRAAAARDVPVFLLGSTADNAAVAVRRLRTEIPALRIVGYASPWFDPSLPVDEQPELRAAIGQLHASGARLVVLGFGSPKQELLLERLRPALPNGAYCNLGASIDFVAGSQVRSPAWMSRVGLEWLFRLLSDPRRLWRRYLVDDVRAAPVFARLAIARVRRRPVTSWVPR